MAYIFKRGKYWWIRDRAASVNRSTGLTNKKDASAFLDDYHAAARLSASRVVLPASVEVGVEVDPAPDAAEPEVVPGVTVADLVDRYLVHCREYYRDPDGTLTSSFSTAQTALLRLRETSGPLLVANYRARHLKALRASWIDAGLSRHTINAHVGYLRRAFAWGVEEELVPVAVHQRLMAIRNLQRFRTRAREYEKVQPAPWETIEAILPHLSPVLQSMVHLQYLTGARAGELVQLTPAMFATADREVLDIGGASVEVFVVRLEKHKLRWRGHVRELFFGPKAMAIIRPYLLRDADAPLFSPRESFRQRYADCPTHRRPNQKPNPRRTSRRMRAAWDVGAYRQALERACAKANVEKITPHQIRHLRLTDVRRDHDLDVVQRLGGHSRVDMSEHYAQVARSVVLPVIAAIG